MSGYLNAPRDFIELLFTVLLAGEAEFTYTGAYKILSDVEAVNKPLLITMDDVSFGFAVRGTMFAPVLRIGEQIMVSILTPNGYGADSTIISVVESDPNRVLIIKNFDLGG